MEITSSVQYPIGAYDAETKQDMPIGAAQDMPIGAAQDMPIGALKV